MPRNGARSARVWHPLLAPRASERSLFLLLHFAQRLHGKEGREWIGRPGGDRRVLDGGRRNRRRQGIRQVVRLLRGHERLFLGERPFGSLPLQIKDDAAQDDESRTEAAQMGPVGDTVVEGIVLD